MYSHGSVDFTINQRITLHVSQKCKHRKLRKYQIDLHYTQSVQLVNHITNIWTNIATLVPSNTLLYSIYFITISITSQELFSKTQSSITATRVTAVSVLIGVFTIWYRSMRQMRNHCVKIAVYFRLVCQQNYHDPQVKQTLQIKQSYTKLYDVIWTMSATPPLH